MTDYVILRRNDGDPDAAPTDEWVKIAVVTDVSSARRAISGANLGNGEYVAVPARSFVPLTVKVEQTTKVTIG